MKRVSFVAILTVLTFSACKSKTKSGWPESERKAFLESCEKKAVVEMGGKAKPYCQCMMGKIEGKYPKAEDAMKIGMGEMMEMARDCIK